METLKAFFEFFVDAFSAISAFLTAIGGSPLSALELADAFAALTGGNTKNTTGNT